VGDGLADHGGVDVVAVAPGVDEPVHVLLADVGHDVHVVGRSRVARVSSQTRRSFSAGVMRR